MANVPVAQVAMSGLQLVRRRPRSFFAWVGLYLIYYVIVIGITLGAMAPMLGGLASGEAAQAEMEAMSASPTMLGLNLLTFPLSLVLVTMIVTAIYRAVLRPQEGRYAYLRLGADEWRCLGVMVVLGLLALVAMLLFVGLAAGLAAVAGPVRGWVIFLSVVVGIALYWFVAVRLSLALAITLAERRFSLFDSWGLTRGHFWPLLGAYLLALVVAIGIVIVCYVAALAVGFAGIAAFSSQLQAIGSTPNIMTILAIVGPLMAGFLVVGVTVGVLMVVIAGAPPAAAYMRLKSDPQAAAETFA